ncbi:ParB N-terminal domain-containing protein [Streptomyces sp. NBC_00503]|uniref:ParB N-terminal domain-containing protein n=1 Tax=Streptomyces sp. NBC_00503 TaxID=2903659 RepID=UPI002E81BE70|nr:ParB N-terminal domain-containing protein [Streptomyces sp. NBC_00503]WUD86383.1 ParB N-terminal domain-containing protein [Streptomyces sp. NBC_00503]
MSVDTLPLRAPTAPVPPESSSQDWQSPTLSPVELVSITSLLPPAHSPRADGEDADHARVLADSGGVLPPITVHRATLRVIDGVHRVRAALLRGEVEIPVRFFEGDAQDAFVLGVEANTTHGRPLSAADRTAAAARILVSHPQWSDRAVSAVAGLSAKAVGAVRRSAQEELPRLTARVGRDGRLRPVDGASGRIRAGELLAQNPQASLREIAKVAGISPSTVRDVRERLGRGEDPVPPKQRATPAATAPHDPAPAPVAAPVHRTPSTPTPVRRAPLPAADHARLLDALLKDPTLRYTESGRYLLRLLSTHMIPGRRRGELARSVPEHCAAVVSAAARECAAAWTELAEFLETQSLEAPSLEAHSLESVPADAATATR